MKKPLKEALSELIESYGFTIITSDCKDVDNTEMTYLSDGDRGIVETYLYCNDETQEQIGIEVFIPEGEDDEEGEATYLGQ